MTEVIEYWEARARALSREIDADPRIVLVGGYLSLPFNPPDGLIERHADRVLWPPISEMAAAGFGVGAAMGGLKPLVPLGTASFMFYAWPQIASEAPNVRYLSGGRVSAPVVFHIMSGSRRSSGAQHEHTPQAMLQNVPGLHIYAPGTPADVDALVHAAFRQDDPVLWVDHVLLANARGSVPDSPADAVGRAELVRDGGGVLLVSYSYMLQRCLEAADLLATRGVEASVLNLRTLAPLPVGDVLDAVRHHPATLFVDESRAAGSTASHLMARVLEENPGTRASLVCTRDAPAPYAVELLDEVVPTADRVSDEALALLGEPPS